MKRRAGKILKWIVRVFLMLVALVLLLLILFYLFRGRIKDKALDSFNEIIPGEVMLGQVNLRLFKAFPDISLQLTDLTLNGVTPQMEPDTIPVADLEEIIVSVNPWRAIRGSYDVSKVWLGAGAVHYIVDADSSVNFERALGDLLAPALPDTIQKESAPVKLDLKQLIMKDLRLHYHDQTSDTEVDLALNELHSSVRYYPDTIKAFLQLEMETNRTVYLSKVLERGRPISFYTSVVFDQVNQHATLGMSKLDFGDLGLKVEGEVSLKEEEADLEFSASNRGIELLNFLLKGVLNLDVIEQIGDGEIGLNGTVQGSFADQLPLLELNFYAREMGFRINEIGQSVTGIGFDGFVTNGLAPDFSQASARIDSFRVQFPDGAIQANLAVKNLVDPELTMSIDGSADLALINEIVELQEAKDISGKVTFDGAIAGQMNMESQTLTSQSGRVNVYLSDVSAKLPDNRLENLSGSLFLEQEDVGFSDLQVNLDGNQVNLDGRVKQAIPFLLGDNVNPRAELLFAGNNIQVDQLTGDTLLGAPIDRLVFELDLKTDGPSLRKAMSDGSIPQAELAMHNLQLEVPGFPEIKNGGFELSLQKERLDLSRLKIQLLESDFGMDLGVENYQALLDKDSSEILSVTYDLQAGKLIAKELFTIRDSFMILPEAFSVEEIQNLKMDGVVSVSVGEVLDTVGLPDFQFALNKLELDLKEYKNPIRDFSVDLEHAGDSIFVNWLSGRVGKNDFELSAQVMHLLDSTRGISGEAYINSDYLNIDDLMDYSLLASESAVADTLNPPEDSLTASVDTIQQPLSFAEIDFPQFNLGFDLKELHVEGNDLFNIGGALAVSPYKIITMDRVSVQTESGGMLALSGQVNVSDDELFTLSATIDIDTINLSDFNLTLSIDGEVFTLEDNLNGTLSANGLAEFFLTPELSIDVENSTAMFYVTLEDGRIRNFTPLQALSRFTGNTDLNDLQFGKIENPRGFTLANGTLYVPLMGITSSIGIILIEGEQDLDGGFLYLARVPAQLIRSTAWNVVSNQQRKDAEKGQVEEITKQKFARVTINGRGDQMEVKLGDKRDKVEE